MLPVLGSSRTEHAEASAASNEADRSDRSARANRSQPRFRFTLRRLFGAVTVLCGMLAVLHALANWLQVGVGTLAVSGVGILVGLVFISLVYGPLIFIVVRSAVEVVRLLAPVRHSAGAETPAEAADPAAP